MNRLVHIARKGYNLFIMKSHEKNVVWQQSLISYKDRCRFLKQKGKVIWFTGLPGSGKSTLAYQLEKAFFLNGNAVFCLDGDNIRHALNINLGFSKEDRQENIRRVAEVAKLFCENAFITLAAFITPFRSMRELAKEIIGEKNFLEVFVKCSIAECKRRDPKGFYKKAESGLIDNFTGVTGKYEIPEEPDITVDTELLSIIDSVSLIFNSIKKSSEGT
jgi:adenylyl-sulfate kinase